MVWILGLMVACGSGGDSGASSVPGAAVTWHQELIECPDDLGQKDSSEVLVPVVDEDAVLVYQALRCFDGTCSEETSDLHDGNIRTLCRASGITMRVSWAE